MVTFAGQPPLVLQIYREPVKPACDAAYDAIERETARAAAALGCPHPYLGAESITGPKEVWWFNGYSSLDEKRWVADAYAWNQSLTATLEANVEQKKPLTSEPIEVIAGYRAESSGGSPWSPGIGRFLIVTVTRDRSRVNGTVFEGPDGTRFIVRSAPTRAAAERFISGSGTDILAVRPDWSFPSEDWIAADPEFWAEAR